jgi:hypothetical protein
VEKVAQSKQLGAADHPEILVLFENWLEELEFEVIHRLPPFALGIATLPKYNGNGSFRSNLSLSTTSH